MAVLLSIHLQGVLMKSTAIKEAYSKKKKFMVIFTCHFGTYQFEYEVTSNPL